VSQQRAYPGLVGRIIAIHELLDSMGVAHQFGGAIALAWYRDPRATADIDLNITVAPENAAPILGAIEHIGVRVSRADRQKIKRDGQARLDWDGSYLDLFFATLPLHEAMAKRAREVAFGPGTIPILAPEHLVACKAIFSRPKDWLDIETMVAAATPIDRDEALAQVAEIVGWDDPAYQRLSALL
jgi:hypothetical protein